LERIEMAESVKNPVGAIALENLLAEEIGYSDDSTAKLIAGKKKNARHGESTKIRYSSDKLIMLIILTC
jgi:hypothetical protein